MKLKTSFVERLNLTIRQGSAYPSRRTICHARRKKRLEDRLELFRCNFIRPHRALKFGRAVRTPTMQAGLTSPPGSTAVFRWRLLGASEGKQRA